MPYGRLEVNELVKTMSKAGSTTNNWDVLCSYDLQALNRVLLEEYKKFPVNSQLNFFTKKTISAKICEELNCNLKFDNPTLSFSSIQSGIYNLKMPISNNSYCNKTIFYKGNIDENTTITIPPGYHILVLGPLKTIKGTGKNKVISSSDEIIEFGDSNQANIVLSFGKDLRQVEIYKDSNIQSKQDLEELLDNIINNFSKNIQEVDYNIVQVVSETAKLGDIVLTPKSFIITTMANLNNTGVLNIWIQTNESHNPKGNPQPSFYPSGTNILPISNNHDNSIIFSKQLIQNLYLRRSLEKNFDVGFINIDPYTNNPIDKAIGIKLVPKSNTLFEKSLNFHDRETDKTYIASKTLQCTTLKISLKETPFFLTNDNNVLSLKWYWTELLSCVQYDITTIACRGCQSTEDRKSGTASITCNLSKSFNITKNNYHIHVNISINKDDLECTASTVQQQKHDRPWYQASPDTLIDNYFFTNNTNKLMILLQVVLQE